MSKPRLPVILTVDTEEDNWIPTRAAITTENVRELPRFQEHCDRLGIPVTYFATYRVVNEPWAADLLRDLRSTGRAEIAAHLHPWNTPPLDEAFIARHMMLRNLPLGLQRAKLAELTACLDRTMGVRPTSFRTGRFGLGLETTQALIEEGYTVDSSVTPWISWTTIDEGPDFVGAPITTYTLDGNTDPRMPVSNGRLLEVPLSTGYSHGPLRITHAAYTAFRKPWARPLKIASVASRLGVVRALSLTPEATSLKDMLRLVRVLVSQGATHLCALLHSSSLVPGLNPFSRNARDVERLFDTIAGFVEALDGVVTPEFMTLGSAAHRLRESIMTRPASGGTDF